MSDQERAMTVTPAPALLHGGTEPGWSPASVTPHGPGYCRYVPGKGMLKVGYENHQYRWWLLAGPAKARPGRDGFADPREAMRDADRLTAMLAPGIFEALTIDELRALYRELVQAYPEYHSGTTNTDRWYEELASVRDDLLGQLEIAALDPAYNGPDPLLFAQAARLAFTGAGRQARRTSPNNPHRRAVTGAVVQVIETGPDAGAGRLMPPGPQERGRAAGPRRPAGPAASPMSPR